MTRWLVCLLVIACSTVALPAQAFAQETGREQSAFTSYRGALLLTVAVVGIAFLVNRFAPKKRKHVRRSVIILGLYLASIGASFVAALAGSLQWSVNLGALADFLAIITIINVAAILVFELGLPAIKVDLATIVVDLAMGAGYIVAMLAVLRRSGVNFSGIVATSAVVTGILALSLQATLGNILGGIALQLDNSIHAGDWVQLENGKQGKVREIRWRHTVIETRDWDTLIVPNAALLAATIMILGKREGEPAPHRMWVYFNVDFRHPPTDVIDAVESALRAAPIQGVASDPPPNCICMDFAKEHRDSFGYYAVRYWLTDLARDDPTSSLVRTRIYSALKRANIALALPAAQIFVEQDDVERRQRKQSSEEQRRVETLANFELLKPLTDEERADVAKKLRFAPFAAGETITKQGAVAHWLYIVTEGTAEVRVEVGGKEKVVAKITAPGFFGEMGLMTGEPRTATVVAVTDVDCYRLEKEAFHAIITRRPEIANDVSAFLAQRRVELQAAREDLDAVAQQRRLAAEKTKILSGLQKFFGLDSDNRPSRQP